VFVYLVIIDQRDVLYCYVNTFRNSTAWPPPVQYDSSLTVSM